MRASGRGRGGHDEQGPSADDLAQRAARHAAQRLGVPLEQVQQALSGMGIDLGSVGRRPGREETLRAHEEGLRHQQRVLEAGSGTLINWSSASDAKPADEFPQPPPLESLTPISVGDLTLQTTHR
jgi:hypothetical protein